MKFLVLLTLILGTSSAFAGGVESRPGWVSISLTDDNIQPIVPDFGEFDATSLPVDILNKWKLPPKVSPIEIKIDGVDLGGRLIEAGGVESFDNKLKWVSADAIPSTGIETVVPVVSKIQGLDMNTISTIKYVSETPEAVYLQVNNSNKILEIKNVELTKSQPLWNKVSEATQTSQWVLSH